MVRLILLRHGNSLRALVKYLDRIPANDIAGLEIPTGVPLIYELHDALRPIGHHYLENDLIYGNRLERVVLFGSRARDDADEDSDYEVAVFLNDRIEGDLDTRWRELDRLADLRSAILSNTEAFIDAKPYPAGAYRNPTPLMGEIRREGVDL